MYHELNFVSLRDCFHHHCLALLLFLRNHCLALPPTEFTGKVCVLLELRIHIVDHELNLVSLRAFGYSLLPDCTQTEFIHCLHILSTVPVKPGIINASILELLPSQGGTERSGRMEGMPVAGAISARAKFHRKRSQRNPIKSNRKRKKRG